MPFRGAGLVAPASRRQFCAAAGGQKIAGETPTLPNPNLDDEARDHRMDPSNRREKPRLVGLPQEYRNSFKANFSLRWRILGKYSCDCLSVKKCITQPGISGDREDYFR
jgi:hypothetical protein